VNCERVRHLISAYLDRELSPEEFRLIRAHLVTCDVCQAELEAEAAVKEALGGLKSREAPEDFLTAVLSRLWCEPGEERRRPRVCALRWAAVGAAAALVLAWPLVRQWRRAEYVVETPVIYRQHALASAARPLADRVLTGYYYAVAGREDAGLGAAQAADRVKLVGQSLPSE
jgi:predicted anti-sigma-YlaC factor YlaD